MSHQMAAAPAMVTEQNPEEDEGTEKDPSQQLSKNAQKKLLKQQRYEAKKAEKKAAMKEHKKKEVERKRNEWDQMLQELSEEDRLKLIESRKVMRKEMMDKRTEEKESKLQRLNYARLHGQKIVVDLEFADLMAPNEIHSLVQQIMYCYAVNGRCSSPCHLWLTGCSGEMEAQLKRLPGFDKWIVEKESHSYMEAFEDRKDDLVYLTADSENVLEELDVSKIYIVGGLVDRNRWKGITMKKAQDQGIHTAKLPIGNYLKMSSSQVLTVNQVIEIMLKYLETKDWKSSFFRVIPQRKRCGGADDDAQEEDPHSAVDTEKEDKSDDNKLERKRKCLDAEPPPDES